MQLIGLICQQSRTYVDLVVAQTGTNRTNRRTNGPTDGPTGPTDGPNRATK